MIHYRYESPETFWTPQQLQKMSEEREARRRLLSRRLVDESLSVGDTEAVTPNAT